MSSLRTSSEDPVPSFSVEILAGEKVKNLVFQLFAWDLHQSLAGSPRHSLRNAVLHSGKKHGLLAINSQLFQLLAGCPRRVTSPL